MRREFLSHKDMEERVRNLDKEEEPGDGLSGPMRPLEETDDSINEVDGVDMQINYECPFSLRLGVSSSM